MLSSESNSQLASPEPPDSQPGLVQFYKAIAGPLRLHIAAAVFNRAQDRRREIRLTSRSESAKFQITKSGWFVTLPQQCVVCGDEAEAATTERHVVYDLRPTSSCLLFGTIAALLVSVPFGFPRGLLIAVAGTMLGIMVGFLRRRELVVHLTQTRCERHPPSGNNLPMLRFASGSLVVRVGKSSVRRAFWEFSPDPSLAPEERPATRKTTLPLADGGDGDTEIRHRTALTELPTSDQGDFFSPPEEEQTLPPRLDRYGAESFDAESTSERTVEAKDESRFALQRGPAIPSDAGEDKRDVASTFSNEPMLPRDADVAPIPLRRAQVSIDTSLPMEQSTEAAVLTSGRPFELSISRGRQLLGFFIVFTLFPGLLGMTAPILAFGRMPWLAAFSGLCAVWILASYWAGRVSINTMRIEGKSAEQVSVVYRECLAGLLRETRFVVGNESRFRVDLATSRFSDLTKKDVFWAVASAIAMVTLIIAFSVAFYSVAPVCGVALLFFLFWPILTMKSSGLFFKPVTTENSAAARRGGSSSQSLYLVGPNHPDLLLYSGPSVADMRSVCESVRIAAGIRPLAEPLKPSSDRKFDQMITFLTQDQDADRRLTACEWLGSHRGPPSVLAPALLAALKDEAWKVRFAAAIALRRLKSRASAAAPVLGRWITDPEVTVHLDAVERRAVHIVACQTLHAMGPAAMLAIAPLQQLARSGDSSLRLLANWALSSICPSARHGSVRIALQRLYGRCVPKSPRLRAALGILFVVGCATGYVAYPISRLLRGE